jgi:hypothetical protein
MTISCDSLRNFRFKGRTYRIVSAGIEDNQPHATIDPHDAAFYTKLLAHIQAHGNLEFGTGGYPECFQCFAGQEESEKKLLLEQRDKQGS